MTQTQTQTQTDTLPIMATHNQFSPSFPPFFSSSLCVVPAGVKTTIRFTFGILLMRACTVLPGMLATSGQITSEVQDSAASSHSVRPFVTTLQRSVVIQFCCTDSMVATSVMATLLIPARANRWTTKNWVNPVPSRKTQESESVDCAAIQSDDGEATVDGVDGVVSVIPSVCRWPESGLTGVNASANRTTFCKINTKTRKGRGEEKDNIGGNNRFGMVIGSQRGCFCGGCCCWRCRVCL